ncbi:MAG: hypothetical protein IJG84_12825 [Kiritimatiellae bacterium]|nr:hypothetical protein [Kiritimatiellia bacterium]
MKKLLTTVSAVAVAMGLSAATLSSPTGTSFERPTSGSAGPYDITDNGAPAVNGGEQVRLSAGETYWATNETSTLTLVAGTSISGEGDVERPTVYTTADQDYYLDIKTTLGNPVSRFVNADTSAVDIGTGLYFDSFVKFTAFDDDPQVVTNGEKLAIWLKEVYGNGDSADPTGTNLMITAGWLGVGVTNYSCTVANTSFNDGGWHRVTVKMIDNIYPAAETPVPAFVVFIDGVYAQCTGEDKGIVSGNVNPKYAANVSEGALFPSALQGAAAATAGTLGTVKAVDFDGQGSVDDIVFTTAVPDDWAKDTEFFTIAFDSTKVDYVDWELNGSAAPRIYATTNVVYASGAYFRLTGVKFKQGYMLDDITGITFDSSTGLYNPTADSTLTIAAKSAGATVNGVGYETAAAAFAAISAGTAGAGPFTVALNAEATSGVELDSASDSVILDLAGNNISAGSGDAAAITLVSGTLLVTNSTVAVGEVTGYNGGSAVTAAGGALTIAGGIYNGAIEFAGATVQITGGSFSVNDNKDPDSETVPPAPNSDLAAAAAAAGNELVVGSGSASYYTVQKAPTYVAQVGETQYETLAEAFAAATNGATLKVLSDLTEEAPLPELVAGGSMTLDLNGKTIVTAQAGNYWMVVGGTLVVTDSTEQATGKIQATPTGATIFKVDGTFTLAAGTLDMTTIDANNTASGFNVNAGATGYMNGGTVLGRIASGTNTATIVMNGGAVNIVQSKNGGAVTINGGDVSTTEKTGTGSGTIVIPSNSAARFGTDQSQYCAAGYCTTLNDGWYTVGLVTYTIAYKDNDGNLFTAEDWADGYTAPTTFTVTAPATLPVAANIARDGVTFNGWTNSVGTTIAATTAGIYTNLEVFADFTVLGPTYPTYLEGATDAVKTQYTAWATTYGADTGSAYEEEFLLNVAPGTTGATIDATAISISGTTVTIDINRTVNGVPYVKKAATVAGLATAPQTAITIVPADQVQDLDNGGRITLEDESGTAMFYQIGVQSTPLNQN